MASIARTLRPVAARLTLRTSPRITSWQRPLSSVRAFSVSAAVESRRYTKDHEWVELSEDKKSGVIGITDYAAHALGDVVYVELPVVPKEVAAGDAIGAVESVKSASDINSPVTCTITAVNQILDNSPGIINQGPEDTSTGGGWFAKIEVGEQGVKELEDLMDATAYKEFTEE
ncbi:glycine cleavage H-protein-domain-containing protein [Xylogone sp. PMI_703]|nr:glycine cleavage H-protein-domain-containing protein [Xylogone sp. PMI_703]